MSFLNRQRLGVFAFQANPQRVDLLPGVNTHGIMGRITATVTIAGGAVDLTVISEGVQRLIRSLRIRHDGDDRVGLLSGRQLYHITARARKEITAAVNLAGGGVQAGTAISFDFYLPIALPWLREPILTCWPGNMPVRQELAIYVQWETSTGPGAGSAAGSGALVTAPGDRVVTFPTGPTLELVQVYSTGQVQPWYLARWTPDQTQQILAANAQLPYLLAGNRRITAALFRDLEGPTQTAVNNISTISLVSGMGALRYTDNLNFTMAQRDDAGDFPAAEEAVQTGTYFDLFTDDGWLGSALDPRPLSQPQYQFNCLVPTTSPGVIDVVLSELDVYPGITQVTV